MLYSVEYLSEKNKLKHSFMETYGIKIDIKRLHTRSMKRVCQMAAGAVITKISISLLFPRFSILRDPEIPRYFRVGIQ